MSINLLRNLPKKRQSELARIFKFSAYEINTMIVVCSLMGTLLIGNIAYFYWCQLAQI